MKAIGKLSQSTRDALEFVPFGMWADVVKDWDGIYEQWCLLIDERRLDGDFR